MEREYWLKQSRQENLVYLVMWSLLFLAPILSLYVRTISYADATFEWAEVFVVWKRFAIYLALFLAHNFLLAPLLVHRHKRLTYLSVVAVILAVFTFYQCNSRPVEPPKPVRSHNKELVFKHKRPPHNPSHRPEFRPGPKDGRRAAVAPPPIIGEYDILAIVVLILLFGANVGIKGYYRSRDDHKRLAELERENLEQQLEYLRYQVNPHFFMNTLNNIHALVDIDPEKAKDTIVELSKMMRYVLYEGDKQHVLLFYELDFIRHYVALMQLRYTDKVKITLDLPQEVTDYKMPPLILITFIENAFKHGISYQYESFVEVKVLVEGDKLRFFCRNSKSPLPTSPKGEEKGGIGLANVRKRLDLLYGHDYTLDIQDDADVYSVELTLPLK
ncbi:MAG: histidine kinase [Bacteroidaceae bacterium]|nr:histidine kinase [Bacteroidaceae bacterium]